MKYIMFRRTFGIVVSYLPIIFFENQTHSIIADAILRTDAGLEAVSAGFVYNNGLWNCYGKSESMGLEMHPDDATIIYLDVAASFMHDERVGCKVYGKG